MGRAIVLLVILLFCRCLTSSACPFCFSQDDDQEKVLAGLVGTVLLIIAPFWEYEDGPTPATRSTINESTPEGSIRCTLDLVLNSCWAKTPTLRQRQMEIFSALVGRQTWRPSEDMLAALSGRLEYPQQQEQECYEILSLVSCAVRVFSDAHGNSSRVTPLSRRQKSVEPSESFSKLAALAFPLVLAKIEDESLRVRLKAMQTLEYFLPLIQPDSTGSQPPRPVAGTSPAVVSDRYIKSAPTVNGT